MSKAKKVLLWNYHIVWIERDLFGKTFESAGRENFLLWAYPEFTQLQKSVLSSVCMTGSH